MGRVADPKIAVALKQIRNGQEPKAAWAAAGKPGTWENFNQRHAKALVAKLAAAATAAPAAAAANATVATAPRPTSSGAAGSSAHAASSQVAASSKRHGELKRTATRASSHQVQSADADRRAFQARARMTLGHFRQGQGARCCAARRHHRRRQLERTWHAHAPHVCVKARGVHGGDLGDDWRARWGYGRLQARGGMWEGYALCSWSAGESTGAHGMYRRACRGTGLNYGNCAQPYTYTMLPCECCVLQGASTSVLLSCQLVWKPWC